MGGIIVICRVVSFTTEDSYTGRPSCKFSHTQCRNGVSFNHIIMTVASGSHVANSRIHNVVTEFLLTT